MAKDLFRRYIWLVDTIYQAGKITFDEINNKWLRSSLSNGDDLPKKTFHNHKDAIQNLFDIIIECDTKNGYKYYIENSEDINKNNLKIWLLNTFAINNLISESQKLKDRIQIEESPSCQHYLAPIIEAMRDSHTLEITYQNFRKENSTTFTIEPYFLKAFKQRWYVIAHNQGREQLSVYALDRIIDLKINEETFSFPVGFSPDDYYLHNYGIIKEQNIDPCYILLKANVLQAKYLRSLPLHHSQKEILQNEKESIFQYFIRPTFDFRKEILSMGAEIEVLEPVWFRDEAKNVINAMNNAYQ